MPEATTDAERIGLQACIDAVIADGGGDVLFPPGDYRVVGTLTWAPNINLIGSGGGRGTSAASTITHDPVSSGTDLLTYTTDPGAGLSNSMGKIENLRIIGDSTNTQYVLDVLKPSGMVISNCVLGTCATAVLRIRDGQRNTLVDSRFDGGGTATNALLYDTEVYAGGTTLYARSCAFRSADVAVKLKADSCSRVYFIDGCDFESTLTSAVDIEEGCQNIFFDDWSTEEVDTSNSGAPVVQLGVNGTGAASASAFFNRGHIRCDSGATDRVFLEADRGYFTISDMNVASCFDGLVSTTSSTARFSVTGDIIFNDNDQPTFLGTVNDVEQGNVTATFGKLSKNHPRHYGAERVVQQALTLSSTSHTTAFSLPSYIIPQSIQFEVVTAASGTWDAAFSGAWTTSIVTAGAAADGTRIGYLLKDELAARSALDVVITPNGGGSFSSGQIVVTLTYRDVPDRLEPFKVVGRYLPQEYGAAGDGVTDDTAAIQACVDDMISQGGGECHFSTGTYLISSPITVTSTNRVMFSGSGWDAIVDQQTNGQHAFVITDSIWGRFDNFAIRGQSETGNGVVLDDTSSNWVFDHMFINNHGGHGIMLSNSIVDVRVINGTNLRANGGDGINAVDTSTESNGNGLVVSDCLIMYNSNGIRYGATSAHFHGNIFELQSGAAIHLDASSNSACKAVVIQGNYSELNDQGFVKISTRDAANVIEDITIVGNYALENQSGGATSVVYVSGGSTNVGFKGLTMQGNNFSIGGDVVSYVDLNDQCRNADIYSSYGDETTFINLGDDFQLHLAANSTVLSDNASAPTLRLKSYDGNNTFGVFEVVDENGTELLDFNATGFYNQTYQTSTTNAPVVVMNIDLETSGTPADSLGPVIRMETDNNVMGYWGMTRDGADTTGEHRFVCNVAGSLTTKAFINQTGIAIGTGTQWTGTADRTLVFGDNGAVPTAGTDIAGLYAEDDGSGTVQLYGMNESGETAPVVPFAESVTLAAAATTISVAASMVTVTGDAGANTVATITGDRAFAGSRVVLLFVDALVTITDTAGHGANTIDLSAAFTSADDTTLELIHDGTSWYEISRSVN